MPKMKKILITFVIQNNRFVMKKYLLLPLSLALFSACHESIEERAEREAAEFTRKNCPVAVSEYIVNDSMTCDKDTRTIHYYYTVRGKADTTAIDWSTAKPELVKGVKDATNLRLYKEHGFNFAYTYYSSKNKNKILVDVKITPKDYR